MVSWQVVLKGQVRFGKRGDVNKDSVRGEMGKELVGVGYKEQ